MLEDKSRKTARAPKSKKVENKVEKYVKTSIGSTVTWKNFMTKMKSFKKRPIKTHEYVEPCFAVNRILF